MAATEKRSRGRPSRFDRQHVIEQVMNLFWQRGYENLSFNEIATATGLTRASLYNAFESKEALLFEALEHYSANAPSRLLDDLDDNAAVVPAIYQMMSQSASWLHGTDDELQNGCLVVNCMNAMMAANTVVGKELKQLHAAIASQFEGLLQRAVDQHEVASDLDVQMTAKLITAFVSGISVYSKQGATEQELRTMSFQFLQQLGLPKPQGLAV